MCLLHFRRCWPDDSGNVDDEHSGQCKEGSSHAKGLSYLENGLVFSSTVSIFQAFDTKMNFQMLKNVLCTAFI